MFHALNRVKYPHELALSPDKWTGSGAQTTVCKRDDSPAACGPATYNAPSRSFKTFLVALRELQPLQ